MLTMNFRMDPWIPVCSTKLGVSTDFARCTKSLGSLNQLFANELQADADEGWRKKSKDSLELRAHSKFFAEVLDHSLQKVTGWGLGSFLSLRQVGTLPDGARRCCMVGPDDLTGGQ